jgi:hypothetical protein
MADKKPKAELDRRRFLLGLSVGATTAAAVQVGAVQPAHAYDPGDDETKAKFQETDHVKTFYRVNGYE